MSTSKLIVGKERADVRFGREDADAALKVLGGFGVLFVLVSAIDILLALVPANLSEPDARFAALGATAGALPLLAVGVLAFEIAALGRGSRLGTRVAVGLTLLMTVLTVGALILFVMSHGATKTAAPTDLVELVTATFRRGLASFLFFGTAFAMGCLTAVRTLRPRST